MLPRYILVSKCKKHRLCQSGKGCRRILNKIRFRGSRQNRICEAKIRGLRPVSNKTLRLLFIMIENSEYLQEEEEDCKPDRSGDYKTRSIICDQERRRLQLLSDQKRRREESFNAARNAALISNWGNEDEDILDAEEEELMELSDTKPKPPRLKDMFMLSEWMVTLPEDFEKKWMFVLCPVGKRCLVRCSKGSTSVFGKRGQRLAKFQSALPNGSQRDVSSCRYSNSEVTILDCIWSSQSKCYFILDLLSWKGQPYMDTEISFRVFWIKSKLEEIPRLLERSEQNTYPFIPLDYYPCDMTSITSTIAKCGYSAPDTPRIDGILFYHSEAYYSPGSTPLVLWLKPFMLPEILNITIPEMFEEMKPSSYVNKEQFIMDYEARKMKKKRKIKTGKNKVDEDIEKYTTEVHMLEQL